MDSYVAEARERLYEDVRKALNERNFERAARLAVGLAVEADEEFFRHLRGPICLECNGTAEVVDPEHAEKKVACSSAPGACRGNGGGRMTQEQHAAYLEAKLAPLRPTVTETVPTPEVKGGPVPRLPADADAPKNRLFGEGSPEVAVGGTQDS